MRINGITYYENKKSILGFLGISGDTVIFTKNAGTYDDGSTRSPWKQSFLERLFNKGAQKVVESVDSEKELFSFDKTKCTNINFMPVPPTKVAGQITYSEMVNFDFNGKTYMLAITTFEEDEIEKFKSIWNI